ncbi:MAG TPA: DUF5302 family protein [Candidatus Nanopelagicales bacterium]
MSEPQDPPQDQTEGPDATAAGATGAGAAPDADVDAAADATADPDAAADPNADLKARYRDALAHKHGSSGAHKETHGDAGTAAHSQSTGPTQKMFRRKAGG